MNNNIDLTELSEMIKEVVEDMELRFYDFEFNSVSRTLRVFIDKEKGGVTIADCQKISNALSHALDASELINFPYTLEVSSPGIGRALKKPEHFSWAAGNVVEIDTGTEKITGFLRGTRKDGIVVAVGTNENIIAYSSIKKARIVEEICHGKRS